MGSHMFTGEKVGCSCTDLLAFLWLAGRQAGQGRRTNSRSALQKGGGRQRGERAFCSLGPQPPSDDRPKEEWVGLVRTCLQPAFLASRSAKLLSWYCFFFFFNFLKPDQRWDPAGRSSKISAMRSLGFSRGNQELGEALSLRAPG